jgi:hypothetical protein
MSKRKYGDRFRLLLYYRMIGRHRLIVFLLAAISLGLWYGIDSGLVSWPHPISTGLLFAAGFICLCFWLFTLLGPMQSYAQAREDHLRVQTPFFRLKIPYANIHSVRPIEIRKAFPPATLRASQRGFLDPYFARTAVAVDLQGMPKTSPMLRLFFHKFIFSQDSPGIVLLVDNWIALSHQLSNRIDSWRMQHARPPRSVGSDAAQILGESPWKRGRSRRRP